MPKAKDEAQLALEKEVKRLRKNLVRRVNYAKKKGYSFSEDYIPDLPKTITEGTLRKFSKYTPQHTLKHSVYISPTGTKQAGAERRKEEATERAKRVAKTYYKNQEIPNGQKARVSSSEPAKVSRVLFMTIEDLMWQLEYSWYDRSRLWTHVHAGRTLESYKVSDSGYMKAALETAIAKDGEEAVLTRINDNAQAIYEIIDQVLLGSGDKYHQEARDGEISAQTQKFAAIIKGAPITQEESLYLTDLAERQQNFIVPQ